MSPVVSSSLRQMSVPKSGRISPFDASSTLSTQAGRPPSAPTAVAVEAVAVKAAVAKRSVPRASSSGSSYSSSSYSSGGGSGSSYSSGGGSGSSYTRSSSSGSYSTATGSGGTHILAPYARKRKEKTTPCGVKLTRSLVIYQAAQTSICNMESHFQAPSQSIRAGCRQCLMLCACAELSKHALHSLCICSTVYGQDQYID